MQQSQSLCLQRWSNQAHAGDVPTWIVKTIDKSNTDGVSVDDKDDGNFVRCRLCRKRRGFAARGNDQCRLMVDQIRRQCGQSTVFAMRPTVFNCYVLVLNEARFLQASTQRIQNAGGFIS